MRAYNWQSGVYAQRYPVLASLLDSLPSNCLSNTGCVAAPHGETVDDNIGINIRGRGTSQAPTTVGNSGYMLGDGEFEGAADFRSTFSMAGLHPTDTNAFLRTSTCSEGLIVISGNPTGFWGSPDESGACIQAFMLGPNDLSVDVVLQEEGNLAVDVTVYGYPLTALRWNPNPGPATSEPDDSPTPTAEPSPAPTNYCQEGYDDYGVRYNAPLGKIIVAYSHEACSARCTQYSGPQWGGGCKGYQSGMYLGMLYCRSYGHNVRTTPCAFWAHPSDPGMNSGALGSTHARTDMVNIGGNCCSNITFVEASIAGR
jgi:hypothetical protein